MDTIITITDPKAWWLANRADFPNLSQLAFDTFCVPAMSAEVERVFSRFHILRVRFLLLILQFIKLLIVQKLKLPTAETDSEKIFLRLASVRNHGHKPVSFLSKMLPRSPLPWRDWGIKL